MQQKIGGVKVINLVNLQVIKDLNTALTQGNIQTLKGQQIKNGGAYYEADEKYY